MKTRIFNITTLILALAAGVLFVFPGCGGGGGGGSAPVSMGTDGSGDSALLSDAPAGTQEGFLPDGTPLNAPDPPPSRMSARTVGDAACVATRAFSRTDIVSGGSVFMTFTLSGCSAALDSFVFSDNIPSGLTITTVSVTVNGAPVAYTYEPGTPTNTYHHWYLADVPVDGAVEIPAGATFQLRYKAEDPGTNPSGYLYTWPMYSWAGHDPATSNNIWGYADNSFSLAVNSPLPPGASGGVDYSAFYVNTKAFDGDYKTWWVGAIGYGSWDLYYRFSSVWHMDNIFINFYAATHTPANVSIYYSSDGINWTLGGVMPPGDDKPTLNINQDLKYIWIRMTGTPAIGYPLIRDVDWLPVFESNTSTGGLAGGPSYNQNLYFPSNAFDTDINSWWVGTIGTGAWELYYNLGTPTFVNRVYVTYFSVNHQPPTTTLKYSDDGINWTTAENFPPAVPPTSATMVRTAQYWKIEMLGLPFTNFPLIRTISYGSPAGASGGVNRNSTNTPDKAFDGDPLNTVWMGRDNDGEWHLIYGYAVPYVFNNVKVRYHSAPYEPTAGVNIYTSDDGKAWTLRGAMPATVADPVLPSFPNATSSTLNLGGLAAKFIRVEMLGNPANAFPVVLDIER